MALEVLIPSNNTLPVGGGFSRLFCTSRYGWGFEKFLTEANEGQGIRFPRWVRFYVTYILPLIVLVIFSQGYVSKFMG